MIDKDYIDGPSELNSEKSRQNQLDLIEDTNKMDDDQLKIARIKELIYQLYNSLDSGIFELCNLISSLQTIDYEYFQSINLHDFLMNYISNATNDQFFEEVLKIFYLTTTRKYFSTESQDLDNFIAKTLIYIQEHFDKANYPLIALATVAASSANFISSFIASGFFQFLNSLTSAGNSEPIVSICAFVFRHCINFVHEEDAPLLFKIAFNILRLNQYLRSTIKVFSGICSAIERRDLLLHILQNNILEIMKNMIAEGNQYLTYGCLSIIEILSVFQFGEDEEPNFPHPIQQMISEGYVLILLNLLRIDDEKMSITLIQVLNRFIIFDNSCLEQVLNDEFLSILVRMLTEGSFSNQKEATSFFCELFCTLHDARIYNIALENGGIERIISFIEIRDKRLTRAIITAMEHCINAFPDCVFSLIECGIIEALEEPAEDDEFKYSDACKALLKKIKRTAKQIVKESKNSVH